MSDFCFPAGDDAVIAQAARLDVAAREIYCANCDTCDDGGAPRGCPDCGLYPPRARWADEREMRADASHRFDYHRVVPALIGGVRAPDVFARPWTPSRTVTDTLTDHRGRGWTIGWVVGPRGSIDSTFAVAGHGEGSTLTRDGLTTAPGIVEAPMQEALEVLAGIAGRGGGDVAPDEDYALTSALTRALPGPGLPTRGTRVVLRHDVDRYPFFIAPKGTTGIVTHAEERLITVQLDAVIRGTEDWDFEVMWQDEPVEHFWRDVAPIAAGGSPWAPPARLTGYHSLDCPCRRCNP